MNILKLKNKYKNQACYIVGRGASLLDIAAKDFGPGPVIVLNEAIINISAHNLPNDIYSLWRNGDVPRDLLNYLHSNGAMILCENAVLNDPPSAERFQGFGLRYVFECRHDLQCDPKSTFSHKAALEIAVNVFGCNHLIMVGFDSYRGDSRTVLDDGFIHSEFRPGDYHEQIIVIQKRLAQLPHVTATWFFPGETMSEENPVRLNLGSGPVYEEGYINIDLHDPSADIKMDVLQLVYPDNHVDEIKASHLLEHFSFADAPAALHEWQRVLKPGGSLVLNVPDLAWCLLNWIASPEDQKFGYPLKTIFGNQANPGEYHKTGFTEDRLRYLLDQAGFTNIQIKTTWSHEQQCFIAEAQKR